MTVRRLALLAFVAFVFLVPLALSPYQLTLMNFIGMASVVTAGLVLLTGVGGLTSFGQAAFVGIGAYATAFLTTVYGVPPLFAILGSLAAAGFAALVIGAVTLRLSGHYLPLSTIAWSLSLVYVVGNIQILGGHNGMTGIPALTVFGTPVTGYRYTWLIWFFVLLALLSVRNLLQSRDGRAVRCLRGRRVMLEAFGVDTARLRLAIFIHAALLAGISGWLYAHLILFVNPTPFALNAGIEYLFMAVIGGAGHIFGAVLGATIMTLLRDGLQDIVPGLLGSGGATEIVIFGLLIVVILQRAPQGLMPFLVRLLPQRRRRLTDAARPVMAEPFARREKPAPGTTILSVQGATRRFGGLVAVDGMSFEAKAGEILAVIGPNGAGKSTLFNLLTGVLPVSGGKIVFAGRRIDTATSRAIAALGVARTFQHVQLRSNMSAIENVAVGAHLRSRSGFLAAIFRFDRADERRLLAEARRQLERVGLGDLADEAAGSLALGQQRIVEIARALAADPTILLLDEPAAGLRHAEKQKLAALLSRLRDEGVAVLVVEHDMNFVMNLVDSVVVMNFGQKIAEGPPSAVQDDRRVQEAYLGIAA